MTDPITDPNVKNYVRCNKECGFEAKSEDSYRLYELLEEHRCTGGSANYHWTENLFSPWTLFIVISLGITAVTIIERLTK